MDARNSQSSLLGICGLARSLLPCTRFYTRSRCRLTLFFSLFFSLVTLFLLRAAAAILFIPRLGRAFNPSNCATLYLVNSRQERKFAMMAPSLSFAFLAALRKPRARGILTRASRVQGLLGYTLLFFFLLLFFFILFCLYFLSIQMNRFIGFDGSFEEFFKKALFLCLSTVWAFRFFKVTFVFFRGRGVVVMEVEQASGHICIR